MTDLSIFDYESRAEQGFDVDILHPRTDKPTGVVITLVGRDSQTYERAQTKFQRAMKDLTEGDRDSAMRASCQLLADCTRGWSGIEENGEAVTFTPAAALDIYTRYKGIREQVDRAIAQRARLFQNDKEG